MSEKLNIYQRINEVRRSQGGYIKKDKQISFGSTSYRAVTHDHVTEILRPHLVEQGIVIVPSLLRSMRNGNTTEAVYSFRFVNCDNPEDCFTIEAEAYGMDSGDKGPGKAFSMAKKYAMLKVFEIESGDDEESRIEDKPKPKVSHVDAIKNALTPPVRDEVKVPQEVVPPVASSIPESGVQKEEPKERKEQASLLENIKDTGNRNEIIALIQLHAADKKMTKSEIKAAIKAQWIDSQGIEGVFLESLKGRFMVGAK